MCHVDTDQKNTEMPIIISKQVEFRKRNIIKDKERNRIKGLIKEIQQNVTINRILNT